MLIYRKRIKQLCLLFIGLALLSGCNSKDIIPNDVSPSPTSTAVIETTPESSSIAIETKSITISVLNLSKIEAGMFAVIDPQTGEQINIDGMVPGDTISMEANWPVEVNEFQWALYNTQGDLCIEASTDITEAKTKVTLVLIGTDTIEDVDVRFE